MRRVALNYRRTAPHCDHRLPVEIGRFNPGFLDQRMRGRHNGQQRRFYQQLGLDLRILGWLGKKSHVELPVCDPVAYGLASARLYSEAEARLRP